MSSKMDEIYNNCIANEKLKNGTKYERIASIVYKCLENSNHVIQDTRLSGDGKSASHQIDITILSKDGDKRILIECKDYDKVIGIKVIRDFFGAVHQIKPNEAIVVTTRGFTSGAIKFAKDENIKLAVLRECYDSDWDGLIRKVEVTLNTVTKSQPTITWVAYDEDEFIRINKAKEGIEGEKTEISTARHFIYDENMNPIMNLRELFEPIINKAKIVPDEITLGKHYFDNPYYVYIESDLVKVKGFGYQFRGHNNIRKFTVDDGGRIAILLLKYLDSDDKRIFFDEDLSNWTFDENRTVINNE